MGKNVAVGILRPRYVFFYEVDVGKDQSFRFFKWWLKNNANDFFDYYSIYRTKHGYHLMAYPYSKKAWDWFSEKCPSDFSKDLRPRWNKQNPQVLRISEKWDLKTGKIASPKPKLIYGNFFLDGIMNYKVMYYAK